MELFFDVETTGLPVRGARYTDVNAYKDVRIVSIAWVLRSKNEVLSQHYNIVRQVNNDSAGPLGASFIHGITTQMTQTFGKPLKHVLDEFIRDVNLCEQIIAHNFDFDSNVIASELHRLGIDPQLILSHKKHCTMKSTTDLVKKTFKHSSTGYKWPTLSELYYFCFKKEMPGAHHALQDVEHTAMCFYFVRDNIVDLTV